MYAFFMQKTTDFKLFIELVMILYANNVLP